ncbi:MAG: CotH kinase family protein [Bacteroidales bacterium]|nr:CotH kinase family protein [Bacteroidales bacterium]
MNTQTISKRLTFDVGIPTQYLGVVFYRIPGMKTLFTALFLVLLMAGASAQSSLFDDSKVCSIFIEIPADSLEVIMDDVLSDHYFMARFIFNDSLQRDTLENVGFRLRGNTSRYAQKKSFKISFNEYVPGRRYQEVKKINLNGQHNDPSMIREKLFYDTWKKAGLPERRTSFVRLYINNSYYGAYTTLEEYDKDWLDRVFGENDGNLYKCTYPADLVYEGDDQEDYKNIGSGTTTGGRAYDLQTNETEDDYSDLMALIATLNQTTDTTFIRLIREKLDVDMVLKAFAMDVATGNWDDYMYNKNNYFLYHAADGKFKFIAYDTDNTFGVDWVNRDWATRNCLDWPSHGEPRPLATKLFAIPEFFAKYKSYLDTIATYIIEPDSIFPRIEYLQEMITGAAVEDQYRSLDFGYSLNDFFNSTTLTIDGHTPYGIKPFLSLRQAKIIEQLGTSSEPDEQEKENLTITVYPNPAAEEVKVRLKGLKQPATIMLSDLKGNKLSESSLSAGNKTVLLKLSGLPVGIYMITVEVNGKQYSRKVLHQ